MELKINENEIAQNILNAVGDSVAAKLIKETVSRYVPRETDIERALQNASETVAKEIFLDYLRNNAEFRTRVTEAVEKKLNDELIAKLINSLTSKIYWRG